MEENRRLQRKYHDTMLLLTPAVVLPGVCSMFPKLPSVRIGFAFKGLIIGEYNSFQMV